MFMSKSPSQKPIEIKISTVVAVSAIVHSADTQALDAALRDMTGGVADFFEDDLAVLDVADLPPGGMPVDWASLVALLKKYRLNAVAVRNAPAEMQDAILAQGLSLDSGKTRDDAPPKDTPTAASMCIPRCMAARWPAPRAMPRRASLRWPWSLNWCRSPACTARSRMVSLWKWRADRRKYVWLETESIYTLSIRSLP